MSEIEPGPFTCKRNALPLSYMLHDEKPETLIGVENNYNWCQTNIWCRE